MHFQQGPCKPCLEIGWCMNFTVRILKNVNPEKIIYDMNLKQRWTLEFLLKRNRARGDRNYEQKFNILHDILYHSKI